MKKVFLFCAALLFAGGAMAQNESKWRELARRDYEQCLAKFDSLQRVWPQMSDEDRRAALSALRMDGEAVLPALTSEQISAFLNVDGCLKISLDGHDETVDFSDQKGMLDVKADRDEVYDVNRRTWSAKSKGGTEVSYATYFLSNELAVRHGGALYRLSLIDGACDEPLPYLGVHYYHANGREWCIVTVYKDQALPLQTSTGDAANGKKLLVKAGSVLVFETPANKNVKG